MPNNSAIFTYDGVNGVGSFGAPAACAWSALRRLCSNVESR
jgi:hypothetical protein